MSQDIKIMHFRAGSTVIVYDSVNHGFFYIVKTGVLIISSGSQYGEKELSRFEAGDTFGLVSALTTGKHLATIKALDNVELIRIPMLSLGTYMRTHREVCLKMLIFYSRELKALDRHLGNLNEQTPWDNSPEKLFYDAQVYKNLKMPMLYNHALHQFIQWVRAYPDSSGLKNMSDAIGMLGDDKRESVPQPQDSHVAYHTNAIIFLENEPGIAAYVIKKGAVKLTKLVREREFVIAVLGPGEIFGEQSLLEHKPYSASAICMEPVQLLKVSQESLAVQDDEDVLQKMFESLARRIWFSHKRLAILRIPDPQARLYFFLLSLCKTGRPNQSKNEGDEYVFPFSLIDLCKMCGLLRVKQESIADFIQDPNLVLSNNRITIKNINQLETKVHGHRRRTLASKSFV